MMRAKIERFVTTDIWRVRSEELPKKKLYWFKPLRVFVLSLRHFHEDKCGMRASALTFYSLMSLVPVLAMAFGISKGFGLEKALERRENWLTWIKADFEFDSIRSDPRYEPFIKKVFEESIQRVEMPEM